MTPIYEGSRRLSGAAKAAHERRVLREAAEREVTAALAHVRRRDDGAIPAVLRHLRRAHAIQEVAPGGRDEL